MMNFRTLTAPVQRLQIAILPTAGITAALIFAVTAAAASGWAWLGDQFAGLPVGFWLVALGAVTAAFTTGRSPVSHDFRNAIQEHARRLGTHWDRAQIDTFAAAGWTTGLILAVTGAVSLGAEWLAEPLLGPPVGLWLVAAGSVLAAYVTRTSKSGQALRADLRARFDSLTDAAATHWERLRVDVLATGACALGLIVSVTAAVYFGAGWLGTTVLGVHAGLWIVALGTAMAAWWTRRPTGSRTRRTPALWSFIEPHAQTLNRFASEQMRRSGIAVIPTAAWTAGLILIVTLAASPSLTWLGSTFIGVPAGLWIVLAGAGAAAWMTRRPETRARSRSAAATFTVSRAPEPAEPRTTAEATSTPESRRAERAVLDFSSESPAPREHVPERKPRRAKAAAATGDNGRAPKRSRRRS